MDTAIDHMLEFAESSESEVEAPAPTHVRATHVRATHVHATHVRATHVRATHVRARCTTGITSLTDTTQRCSRL